MKDDDLQQLSASLFLVIGMTEPTVQHIKGLGQLFLGAAVKQLVEIAKQHGPDGIITGAVVDEWVDNGGLGLVLPDANEERAFLAAFAHLQNLDFQGANGKIYNSGTVLHFDYEISGTSAPVFSPDALPRLDELLQSYLEYLAVLVVAATPDKFLGRLGYRGPID